MEITSGGRNNRRHIRMDLEEAQCAYNIMEGALGLLARRNFQRSYATMQRDSDEHISVTVPAVKVYEIHSGLLAKANRLHSRIESGSPRAIGVIAAHAELPIVTGMTQAIAKHMFSTGMVVLVTPEQ